MDSFVQVSMNGLSSEVKECEGKYILLQKKVIDYDKKEKTELAQMLN